jgi:hypothetical protein
MYLAEGNSDHARQRFIEDLLRQQSETEQPDHSATLDNSITSSTRIRFSVHTTGYDRRHLSPRGMSSLSEKDPRRLQAGEPEIGCPGGTLNRFSYLQGGAAISRPSFIVALHQHAEETLWDRIVRGLRFRTATSEAD